MPCLKGLEGQKVREKDVDEGGEGGRAAVQLRIRRVAIVPSINIAWLEKNAISAGLKETVKRLVDLKLN